MIENTEIREALQQYTAARDALTRAYEEGAGQEDYSAARKTVEALEAVRFDGRPLLLIFERAVKDGDVISYPRYTVEPGAKIPAARRGMSYDLQCVICGKKMTPQQVRHHALLASGGGGWGRPEDDDESDPGFMGWFPVGSECHRKYLKRIAYRLKA